MTLHVCRARAFLAALRPLPLMHQRAVDALMFEPGAFVTYEELHAVLWGDREDGGPSSLKGSLGQLFYGLRQRGFNIVARPRYGYALRPSGELAAFRSIMTPGPPGTVADRLLAALADAPGRALPVEALAKRIWVRSPYSPRDQLKTAAYRLRRQGHAVEAVLPAGRNRAATGYVLTSGGAAP